MNQINEQDPQVAEGLRKLKEKLGLVPAANAPVEVGEAGEMAAEVGSSVEEQPVQQAATGIRGKDVDWSEFDLDPNLAHMYPKATFVETMEGPKWVAAYDVFEFVSAEFQCPRGSEKAWAKAGKLSLGDLVTQRVNSPDAWRIATVFNSGPGFGAVMFTRMAQLVLPDPRQLVTDAILPPQATDPELQEVEDSALAWIGKEGQAVEAEAPIMPGEELAAADPETVPFAVSNAEIANAKPPAMERLFSPSNDYTKQAASEKAAGVETPSAEQIAGAALNQPTVRVPLGAGFNATDGEGSILDTSYEVPAVLAKEAGEVAFAALRGDDFETEEGKAVLDAATPLGLEQVELPLDEAGA